MPSPHCTSPSPERGISQHMPQCCCQVCVGAPKLPNLSIPPAAARLVAEPGLAPASPCAPEHCQEVSCRYRGAGTQTFILSLHWHLQTNSSLRKYLSAQTQISLRGTCYFRPGGDLSSCHCGSAIGWGGLCCPVFSTSCSSLACSSFDKFSLNYGHFTACFVP